MTHEILLHGLQVRGARITEQGFAIEIDAKDGIDLIQQLTQFRNYLDEIIAEQNNEVEKAIERAREVLSKQGIDLDALISTTQQQTEPQDGITINVNNMKRKLSNFLLDLSTRLAG